MNDEFDDDDMDDLEFDDDDDIEDFYDDSYDEDDEGCFADWEEDYDLASEDN